MKGYTAFKGRTIEHNQQVEVYRNLHNGKWSVRDKASKLVLGHAESITLYYTEFHVSKAGRERVLREQKKNVHATVLGCVHTGDIIESAFDKDVTYNPYKYTHFMCQGEAITESHATHFTSNGKVKVIL